MILVYCITNISSGKQYVGITGKSSAQRWKEHCAKARRNPTTEFHRSIAKNGIDAFTVQDVASVIRDPREVEKSVIQSFLSKYNMTGGGEFTEGITFTKKVREKIAASNTGKRRTEDQKLRMSIAAKASFAIPGRLQQVKDAAARGRSNIDWSKHAKAMRKCADEGRCFNNRTPEQQAKFRAGSRTPRARAKIAASKRKSIECVTLATTFDSMLSASESTGICFTSISKCARGISQSAGGLVFRYI